MCALFQTVEVVDGSTTFLGFGINTQGEPDITSVLAPIFDPSKAATKEYEFRRQAPDISTTFLIPEYASPGPCAERQSSYTKLTSATTRITTQKTISSGVGVGTPIPLFGGQFEASYSDTFGMTREYYYCFYLSYTVTGTICVSTSNTSDPFLSDAFKADVENLPATFDKTNPSNVSAWFDFFQKYGGYFVSDLIYGGTLQYYNAVTTVTGFVQKQIGANFMFNVETLMGGAMRELNAEYKKYVENSVFQFSNKGGTRSLTFDPRLPDDEAAKQALMDIAAWQDTIPMNPNFMMDIRIKAIADLSFVISKGKNGAMNTAFEDFSDRLTPTIQVQLIQSQIQSTLKSPPPPLPPVSFTKPSITVSGRDVNNLRKPVTQLLPEQCFQPINIGFQVVILDPATIPAPECVLWNKYYPFNFSKDHLICLLGMQPTEPFFFDLEIDSLDLYGDFMDDYFGRQLNKPGNIFIFSTYNMPSSFWPRGGMRGSMMNNTLLGNGASGYGDSYTPGTVGTYQNWISSPRSEGYQNETSVFLNTNQPATYTLIGPIADATGSATNAGGEVFGSIDNTSSISSLLQVTLLKKNINDPNPSIAQDQATVTTTPIPQNIL
ncbi:MAC/Perforin domain-containing protein [Marininema mesophilum]|uniref:MAC/Perforin domain-containing protein n=1 Tax=Marininema mesophilum TaxID=1048340 RepID=A0A1H3D1U8_9BACL|nr:MAC/perforin domain-containing protein [Marininema mesophilum]SDX60316.1 MAC/Perforin domain-containing protein [Marininema mesophilum]